MAGGFNFAPDADLVRSLVLYREGRPGLTQALVWLTQLGGAMFLIPFTLVVAALVWWRSRDFARVGWLLVTIMGGRGAVELLKWTTNRPRPSFEEHPVTVASQAFPSGHAANSMVAYLAIALFALPARWRGPGAVAAVALSLMIGATRPILGVHWPTDVLGGWLFGAAWTWFLWRWFEARQVTRA